MFDIISGYFSNTNFLEIMNTWVLKDKIKSGVISFEEGDSVICFWRKGNGYPGSIKDGEVYTVKNVEGDHLYIHKHSSDGIGWMQQIRIHKTYMIPIQVLRDIKLNSVLS